MAGTLHSFFRKVPKEQQQLKTPAPAKAGAIDLPEQNSRTTGSAKKSDRCTLQQSSGLDSDAPNSAANLSPSEPLLKKSLDCELHSTAKRPRLICAADAQRLSDAFVKDPNPSAQQRLALASELGLSDEQIASWFANKRKTSERTDSTSKNTMQPLNDTTNTHTSQPSTSSARSQPGASQSQPTNSHTAPDNSRTEPEEPESSAPPSGQPSSSEQPPAKRQKTASPDLVLSMEERKVLGAQYSAEADDLRAALSSCWLRDHAPDILRPPPPAAAAAAAASDSKQVVLNKAEVALLVEGRHEPLSQLCTIVALQLAPGPEAPDAPPGPPAPSPLPPSTANQQAVREMMIDVATRSSSITPAAAEADPQEAAGGPGQWRWEVRDLKLLPKPARDFVELARKRRKQLKDRLGKVEEVGRLLLAPTSTKAHGGKISRAMARAEKAGGLEVVEGACQESLSALFAKHSMQREAVVQKEAAKKEKEEHKRAAEEARKKAEEERRQEAERHRLERAAEKEKQRADKEAKKVEEEAKHTGFGSKGALNKSRSILQNFFKPTAKPAASAAAAATAAAPTAPPSTPVPKSSQDPSQKPLFDIPPIPRSDASKAFQVELDAVVAAGQLPGPAVVAALEGFKASWRAQRPLATRLPGAPPTWARRPGSPEAFPAMLEKYYGEGAERRAVRIWRRKLLHHHTSLRPAYYGSFSRTSTEVRGRRPLGQDPSLDYEVVSDEDWEDEPEGESLSEDDGGEEEAKGGEEDEEMDDGFVVDDGYLSEDEGFQGGAPGEEDMMDVDDPSRVAGGPEGAPSGPAAVQPTDPRLQQLEVAMERARRSNRPLLLTTLPSIQAPAPPSSLDSALLSLRAIVLAPPPAAVTAPGDADADAAPFGQAAGAGADRGAGGKPRPTVALAPGVVEQLVAFLQATAEKGIDKVVAAFQAAHPSPRPPSKSRLKDAIRALAMYKGGRWVLESSSPPKHSTENHPPPAPAAGIFHRLATPAKAPTAPPPTTLPTTTAAASQRPPTQPHPTPTAPAPARLPTPTSLPSATPISASAPTPTPTPAPPATTPQAPPSSKHPAPHKPAGIKSYFSTAKAPTPPPDASAAPTPPPASQTHTTRPSGAAPSSAPAAPHNKRKGGSPVKRCTSAAPAAAEAAAGAAGAAASAAAGPSAASAAAGAAAGVGATPTSMRGAAAEGAASVPAGPAAGQPRRAEGGEGSGGAPPPGNQV